MSDDHVLALDDAELTLLHEMAQRYADVLESHAESDPEPARRLEGRIAALVEAAKQPPSQTPTPPAQPPAALVWHRPMLGLVTTQGGWQPEVQLLNQSDQRLDLSGPMMATGRLRRADASAVVSRQTQWAMPAVLMTHHLEPGQTVGIRVAVMLLDDEIAALEPGFYQLTDVRWGELEAADKDVRVD